MKVAMVCFPTPGGSGIVATELGKELARRGHEIHFVSHALPFRLGDEETIKYHQVELKNYSLFPHPLFTLQLAGKLAGVLMEYSPQIVHVHYAVPNAAAALLAREITRLPVKIITTVHGTDITIWGKDPSMGPVIFHSLERSDAVTAVSRSLKEETLGLMGLKKDIAVIHNFIDTGFYRPTPGAEFRRMLAPAGEKIILHISNFRPVKRVADLLQAFKLLREKRNDLLLVLAGDGDEKAEAMDYARRMGLQSCTRFLGTWSDLVPLFSNANLFVLPSEKESFGLAALEAMSCGLPVVATRTGGLPEVVEDKKTGFLVPVGDIPNLAAAMERLLDDDSLWTKFSLRAREKAEEFSTEKIIPAYENLYRGLLL